MPEKLFFELDIEKRNRITEASLREFSNERYDLASTNTIIKNAGISKGSLFKYFNSKEELYFYILDIIIANFAEEMKEEILSLEGDIFEIIIRFASVEFDWHLNNIDKYRLFKKAFSDDGSEIYQKTIDRYKLTADSIYYSLFENMETEILRWDKEKTLNLIKWVIEGFNNDFNKKSDFTEDISILKNLYIRELKEYIGMIKLGLYK